MTSVSRFALILAMLLTLTSLTLAQTTPKYTTLQTDADGTEWATDFSNLYYTGNIIAPVIAISPPRLGMGFILEMDCSDATARILRVFTYDAVTKKEETNSEVQGWYRATGITLKLMRIVCKMDKSKMKRMNVKEEYQIGGISSVY